MTVSGAQSSYVQDKGPNDGFAFTVQVADATTYKVIFAPDVKNTSSQFYTSQWGTYDPVTNPTGFISGASLLQGVTNHESGTNGTSHYLNYRAGLKSRRNDVMAAAEQAISPVANFDSALSGAVIAAGNWLHDAFAVEPCDGGIDIHAMLFDSANNCVPIGKINFPPYVPHP